MTRHWGTVRAFWHTMRVSWYVAWAAAGIATLVTTGRAWPFESTGQLRVWTDCAVFRLADGSPDGYAEFYFEMKRADFSFRRVDDRIRADVHSWVHISDSTGNPVDSVGGAFVAVVGDSSELSDANYTLFFVRSLELPPGSYKARLVVTDLASKASAESVMPVRVPDFRGRRLALSDLELGYDVIEVAGDTVDRQFDVLVKNQYKVYPDCRALVGSAQPRLFFYTEAYNLAFDPTRDNSYKLAFSIIPTDGSPARPLGVQTPTKPGTSAVLASAVSVRDLPSGMYRLRIELSDPASSQSAAVEKNFQVVAAPSDSLTPEEIQRLRDIMAYIARPSDLTMFESLGPVGKRNFMVQFWKDRDPTPGTPVNEFKEEHLERMNYANEKFSAGVHAHSDGWRTDRGRIYIIHGPPDHIDRFPFTSDRAGIEKWDYENLPGQGQAYFLFVDERGYGDYRLVQSTARGERRDPYWERQVQQGELDRPH